MYEATKIPFYLFLLTASTSVIQKAYRMFAEQSRPALRQKTNKAGALIVQFLPSKYSFNDYQASAVGQLSS